ncbi:MAG: hypothetical protein QNJ13_14030 [Paracoccaceae bacterium]|nr:hypothetical protein [Paracoccaceae bacterium]
MHSHLLKTAAVAIALSAASGAALAETQLDRDAQAILDEYGYEIDATTLSTSQTTALTAIDPNDSPTQIRAAIDGVIGTGAPDGDAVQLRAMAAAMFEDYDIEGNVDDLDVSQLAALRSVDTDELTDVQAKAQIYAITGGSDAAVDIGTERQLHALAQSILDDNGVDADAGTLSRTQLVAVLAANSMEEDSPQIRAELNSAVGN